MIIDIRQNKILNGDNYIIFINEKQTHSAFTQSFTFLSEVSLFEDNAKKSKLTLKKRFGWFKTKYDIYRNGSKPFEYRTVNLIKNHNKCQVGNDFYEIYGHKGRKYSIFKNNLQIAYWDKSYATWFNAGNFKIIADDDCDYELVISFCLINDNSPATNNGNALNFDVGKFGPEAKKFDSSWMPKI